MPSNASTAAGPAITPRSPLLRQLFAYWDGKRAGNRMPSRRDMDPVEIEPQLLPWIVLLDVEQTPRRFRYRLIGTRVVEMLDRDLTGRYVDELRDLGPVVDTILGRYGTVVDSRRPLNFEDELLDVNGRRSWAERLALPLGGDDETVEAVMVGFAAHDGPYGRGFRRHRAQHRAAGLHVRVRVPHLARP